MGVRTKAKQGEHINYGIVQTRQENKRVTITPSQRNSTAKVRHLKRKATSTKTSLNRIEQNVVKRATSKGSLWGSLFLGSLYFGGVRVTFGEQKTLYKS